MNQNSPAIEDLTRAVNNPPQWLIKAFGIPRTQGRANANGCEIQYYRWGNPNKPSIVLLHGFLAHSGCWAFIAPFLANDYDVISYDMSGMGDSAWRETYDDQVRSEELFSLCDQIGLFENGQKPTLVAHSYGGRVATYAAHAYKDRFAGLLICDLMMIRPSILKANADKFGPPSSNKGNKPNRIYPDYETARKRFILSPPQEAEVPELADFMAFHSLKEVEGGWQWKFDPRVFTPITTGPSNWAEISELVVSAPIRKAIVYGEESYLFTADSAIYTKELTETLGIDSFPLIGIPQARHHVMLDQPVALTATLRSILGAWAADK